MNRKILTQHLSIIKLLFYSPLVLIVVFVLCSCGNDNGHGEADKENRDQTNMPNERVNGNNVNSLAYNKGLLEASPFFINFYTKSGKADDTTSWLRGKSEDDHLEANIRFDPRDNQFWDIVISVNKLPLRPSKIDVQILMDFTNKFDTGFAKFFDRNGDGIFVDEDKFVDDGKYLNRTKGYCFTIDGDVAMNNMDLRKHPETREQILAIGNFLSVRVINFTKPSFLTYLINTEKTVEK
jgi:hypothetical protein